MSSPHASDRRTDGTERSLSELLSELSDDVSRLLRQEVQLAKVELKQEATKAGKAGALLGAAATLGFVALLLVAWAASWGLAAVLPTGLAFLVVSVVVGAVAAGLGLAGKKRARRINPTPETTIETLKEDKEWLSNQTR
jgi:uncharacterized membrane protein YqjE